MYIYGDNFIIFIGLPFSVVSYTSNPTSITNIWVNQNVMKTGQNSEPSPKSVVWFYRQSSKFIKSLVKITIFLAKKVFIYV